jgi:1-acyl-sn-glycerol-3-phosphate acyltransferase
MRSPRIETTHESRGGAELESAAPTATGGRPLPDVHPRGLGARIAQMLFFLLFVRPFMAVFIGLRVRGREHLPKRDPFVLYANHASHLDTVSLMNLFPLMRLERIQPVAAADYFERNRFVAWLSRTFINILPISRRNITAETNPVRRMQAALALGHSLVIFPEGTRGTGEEIGHFHSGIAHLLAKTPDIEVVPAYLANMGRSLPKGEFIPVPFFCEIRLGAPRRITGSRQEMIEALEAAVHELKNGR